MDKCSPIKDSLQPRLDIFSILYVSGLFVKSVTKFLESSCYDTLLTLYNESIELGIYILVFDLTKKMKGSP